MEQKVNIKSDDRSEPVLPETGEALEQLVERLIEKRLSALRRENESRLAQAMDEGRAEGERLAGMSEDERRRYAQERDREREAELTRREEELKRRELRAHAADIFIERGLPKELAQFTECSDEADCERSVDALEKLFREGVQRAVEARMNETRIGGSGHSLPRSADVSQSGIVRRMRAAAGLGEH